MDLTGRKIWIVGASSGIGAALAHELHQRGAHVAISARREDKLKEVAGHQLAISTVDVTDQDSVRRAAHDVTQTLGGLDIVVFSAGYWQQMDDFDAGSFQKHLDVNLTGLANTLDTVIPRLRGGGMIVGIASVAGYRGLPGAEAYGATKAAQINLLEALRAKLRPGGIDVLTVCPGFVETEMTVQSIANITAKTGRSEEAARAELERLNPSGRLIAPTEVATAALDLILSERNGEAVEIA